MNDMLRVIWASLVSALTGLGGWLAEQHTLALLGGLLALVTLLERLWLLFQHISQTCRNREAARLAKAQREQLGD